MLFDERFKKHAIEYIIALAFIIIFKGVTDWITVSAGAIVDNLSMYMNSMIDALIFIFKTLTIIMILESIAVFYYKFKYEEGIVKIIISFFISMLSSALMLIVIMYLTNTNLRIMLSNYEYIMKVIVGASIFIGINIINEFMYKDISYFIQKAK